MSSDDKETDKYNGTYPEIVTPPCSYYTNLNMIVPIILLVTRSMRLYLPRVEARLRGRIALKAASQVR